MSNGYSTSNGNGYKKLKGDEHNGNGLYDDIEDGRAAALNYSHVKKEEKEDISISYGRMAQRPDVGSAGRPVDILVNMFKMSLGDANNLPEIFHYDVEVVMKDNPDKAVPFVLVRQIWNQIRDTNPRLAPFLKVAAFDGMKNVYSPVSVPEDVDASRLFVEFFEGGQADNEGRGQKYVVRLKEVASIDLGDLWDFSHPKEALDMSLAAGPKAQSCIQALDVLLRHVLSENPTYSISGSKGRKHYDPSTAKLIGHGGEVLAGHFASVRPTGTGCYVNVDVIYSPFVSSGPLLEVCCRILDRDIRRGGLTNTQTNALSRVLKGARVTKTYGPTKARTLKGFGRRSVGSIEFSTKEGKKYNLVQYYKEHLNLHIQFPDLPAAELGGGAEIPIEFLHLPAGAPIPFARILPEQTAEMIKHSSKRPSIRRNDIDQQRRIAQYENSDRLRAWGVTVASRMEPVPARILAAPNVVYHPQNRRMPNINGGVWNTMGMKLLKQNVSLRSWAVVTFDPRFPPPRADAFIRRLVDCCRGMGMDIPFVPTARVGGHDLLTALTEAGKEAYHATHAPPQIIICILPERQAYEAIKYHALFDLPGPVPTQVLLTQKLVKDRGIDSYAANVALKLNVKLSGLNWTLPSGGFLDEETLIIGADVSHPRATRSDQPSISCILASTDGSFAAYHPEIRLQTSRVEIIEDVAEMFLEQLRRWRDKNGFFPKKILCFRDGLSEGEWTRCLDKEVAAIKNVCTIEGIPDVEITFVICAKRHRVRSFAASERDTDRSGNLYAGTVMDSKVVHPHLFDFYLQSHSGLVGTCRPTHYICIKDDNRFNADELQNLCFAMCFMFARASRSVSIVPAAAYAHIVVARCRALFDYEDLAKSDVSTVWSGGSRSNPVPVDKYRISRALARGLGMKGMWFL